MTLFKAHWKKIAWALLGALSAALVLAGIRVFLVASGQTNAIRDTQTGNHQILTTLQTLSFNILDCTKAGGTCYERGQSQTASAIGSINTVSIIASVCALNQPPDETLNQRIKGTTKCVKAHVNLDTRPSETVTPGN